MMAKLPKTKQGAVAAAKKAMGPEAIEGVDFSVRNTGAGWTHEAADQAAAAPKAKGQGRCHRCPGAEEGPHAA
jgi:hypothetical protein